VFADPGATVFVQVIVELDKLGGADEAYRKVGQVLLASLEKLGVQDAWYKHRGSIRVRAEKIATFVISEIEGMAVVNGILFIKPVDTNTFLRVVWVPPEIRDKVTEPLTCLEQESGRTIAWDLIKDTLVGALEETFQVEITESPMLRDEMFGYEKLRSLAYKARGKQ
jgi:lipoate-protein ligase A